MKYIYLLLVLTTAALTGFIVSVNSIEYQTDSFGSTLTTINATDLIKDSRAVINTNFSTLNTDKMEKSDWYSTTTAPQITTLTNLASIGTITSGTWNGSTLTVAYGGTGSTTLAANKLLLGNGTSSIITIADGTAGQLLTASTTGNLPYWSTPSVNLATDYTWTGLHTFQATTTLDKVYLNYTPTYGTDATTKTYVDTKAYTHLAMASNASSSANITAGATSTMKTLYGVGTFTMGANDIAIIRAYTASQISSGNEIVSIDIGNGSATSTVLYYAGTDYFGKESTIKIINRGSTSSQIIHQLLTSSNHALLFSGSGDTPTTGYGDYGSPLTTSIDLSNGFNVVVKMSSSSGNEKGNCEYANVELIKN